MKTFAILFVAAFALCATASAQTPEQTKKADEVMVKMRQIDLLNHIVPLVLTKEQILKLLPPIEKARQRVATIKKQEAEELGRLDKKLSDAVDTSMGKGVPPGRELLQELAATTLKFQLRRDAAVTENTDLVLKAFNDTVNAGQKKAAANSLAPQLFDPTLDPKKITEEQKLRFFVQEILLDPIAYGLLVTMSK